MILFRPMQMSDLALIDPQERQIGSLLLDASMQRNGQALSGWVGDQCLASFGVEPKWAGTSVAWALFGKGWSRYKLSITRACKSLVSLSEAGRVEAYIEHDWPEALRFIRACGMDIETPGPLKGFLPNGNSAYIAARVR